MIQKITNFSVNTAKLFNYTVVQGRDFKFSDPDKYDGIYVNEYNN